MKILITGATGFIGTSLSAYLLSKGYTVHYLTTNKSKMREATRFHGFYWNPAKSSFDVSSLEGVSVIVHLAGENIAQSWSAKNKKKITDSRIDSSAFLYQVLKENHHQVKQIICASAIGIYKDSLTIQHREDSLDLSDNFLGNLVRRWEAQNKQFELLNIGVTLLRFGLVCSKKDGALPQMIAPIKNYFGAVLGSGLQYHSWIHREDVIGIVEFAIQNQLCGTFNVVAPHPVSHKEFTLELARLLHRKIRLPHIPVWLLKLILGEKHILVTESQWVSAAKIEDAGYVFKFPVLKPALENLLK